jgi:transposase InsO family protein
MSQRRDFVHLAGQPGANVRELCRRFGISPPTAYKWLARHRAGGDAGLADRPRRPLTSPGRTACALEQAVVALRRRHPAWGGRKLRRRLKDLGHAGVPAASTITAILRRGGLLPAGRAAPGPHQFFEAAAPNDLWQMDFKGHFGLADGGRCHPLTVLDDHSRFAVGLLACGNEQGPLVQDRLTDCFRRFGLPARLLCDNGPPWGDSRTLLRHTRLTVWLLRLGVGVIHGRPRHPQTQGKEERFHRTLTAELLQGRSFRDLAECQRRFDAWRALYNHQRPHEALDLGVPAGRYRASPRPFPERLPAWEYDRTDAVRKVQAGGVISFRGRDWPVGEAFRGEHVAVRPTTTDGLWRVHFGVHPVAEIDLLAHNTPGD